MRRPVAAFASCSYQRSPRRLVRNSLAIGIAWLADAACFSDDPQGHVDLVELADGLRADGAVKRIERFAVATRFEQERDRARSDRRRFGIALMQPAETRLTSDRAQTEAT